MSHILQLLLLLSIIIAAAKLAGAAANRVGQPAVLGEILVGLVLGPTLLNVLGWPIFADPAPLPGEIGGHPALLPLVRDLADLGVILLMFIAGMETDLAEMRRVGRVAFWAAAGGVALPMVGGALTASYFGLPLFWEGIFVGTILTATSVSISAQTLMELGALRSKEGATILGAAVIDDVMGIMVLSVVVALARTAGSADYGSIIWTLVRMTAYFGLAILLRKGLEPIARWADGLGVSQGLVAAVVVVALLYAWAAEYLGQIAAITGSYIAGVLFAQTRFKKRIDEGIHPLTYSVLVPVFFVSIGLRANGRELGSDATFTIVLVAVAIVAKALGCGLFARLFGFSTRASVRVGVGMISRGEVGLIVASYGLSHGLIGPNVFSASVIMVLATTMVTPPLLRATFPSRRGRRPEAVEETVAGSPEEIDSPH
jgi:Kef-type K+ transport system membrane component KefB